MKTNELATPILESKRIKNSVVNNKSTVDVTQNYSLIFKQVQDQTGESSNSMEDTQYQILQ
jgi:hypothetical protein